MSKQCSRLTTCATAPVVLALVARLVLSAPEDLPTPSSSRLEASAAGGTTNPRTNNVAAPALTPIGITKQYVGTNQCFTCHRPQTDTWSKTKHAHAFTDVPKKYQNDAGCLNCHVTGFGQPGGYVAGTEKDLLMVGCEACHGPGDKHIDAAKRFVLADPSEEAKIEKEMRDTIRKTPSDNVCITCHITQAHHQHPAYEGQPTSAAVSGSSLRCIPVLSTAYYSPSEGRTPFHAFPYTVKTCGGCHYDVYKQWRVEKHADLLAMLPAKFQNDQSCIGCHQNNGSIEKTSNAANLHHGRIGLACESCHGPALEHVRFNRQFISGPPLGPKLEQAARDSIGKGKPETSCIQCHVSHGHKEHPKFDAK